MKYALIGVAAFIIVVYVYTFIKHRKKKNSQTSTVKEFRQKYLKKNPEMKGQHTSRSDLMPNRNIPEGYTRYLTKYNSSVDYVDKNEFLNQGSNQNNHPQYPKYSK